MSWQREVDELKARQALARRMGGPDKLKRQKSEGRLNARERIAALVDKGSFRELGELAGVGHYSADGQLEGFTPSNILVGRARLDGRPVVVTSDDFTVRGGAADAAIHQKLVAGERLALEYKMPHIRMIEGTGGGGSVKTLEQMGFTYVPELPGWEVMVANLATVPVVSLGLGAVAGLGAGRMVMSHYSLLVKGQAQMFVAGPPVVAAVGEKRTKEELGGSSIHARNGAIDDEVASEAEAFAKARRFLSYLPGHVDELAARVPSKDDPNRRDDGLIEAVPRDSRHLYPIRPILEAIVDHGSLFEIGRQHGPSLVTALARLDGWPVAVMASDPMVLGGLWTAAASRKAERFIDLAETFHLPVVHLVDNPGFLIGRKAEEEATIRYGCRALTALYQASVPWCAVILRKAYGMAGSAHANASRFKWRYAWPSGDWGSLPIAGGLEAAYKADLEKAEDPKALLADIKGRLEQVRSPFRTAERYGIEEIIDPRDTRPLLCEFAGLAQRALTPGPRRFGFRP
jgi:acetyl-CoA carboxylase carboxyltransferase component